MSYYTKARLMNKIRKAVEPAMVDHLDLVKGDGYMYFVFDDDVHFQTHSVMTQSMNDFTMDMWVAEAKDFIANVQEEISQRMM